MINEVTCCKQTGYLQMIFFFISSTPPLSISRRRPKPCAYVVADFSVYAWRRAQCLRKRRRIYPRSRLRRHCST